MPLRCERDWMLDISEVEALKKKKKKRLENPSSAKQPPSSSPLSFIPVNMLRHLWKGLIQRLFCAVMTVCATSCQSQETKKKRVMEGGKKSMKQIKEEVIQCFQMLVRSLGERRGNKRGFTHFQAPQMFWRMVSFMRNAVLLLLPASSEPSC